MRGARRVAVGRPQRKGGVSGKFENLTSVGVHDIDEAPEEEIQEIFEVFGASRTTPGVCLREGREPGNVREQQRGVKSFRIGAGRERRILDEPLTDKGRNEGVKKQIVHVGQPLIGIVGATLDT